MALKDSRRNSDGFDSRSEYRKQALKPLIGAFLVSDKKTVPKTVPCKKYRKRFERMQLPYKLPTIVRPKDGDWFIKYFYEWPDQPGVYKEWRVRDGINYIHDSAEKEKAVQELLEDVTYWLEVEKYNPFEKENKIAVKVVKKKIQIEIQSAAVGGWTLEKGAEEFMKYCRWKKLSSETIRTYQTFVNNFTEYLTESNKLTLIAAEYLESDYVKFLDIYNDQEDWTPRTYNNHLAFLITIFKRMQTLERKENRDLRYHINLEDLEYKTDKAEKNRAYSGLVADRVKQELAKPGHEGLQQFIKFIYLSCMRPKEIRLLQIQHIDTQNRQIKVTAPTGKTGDRFVPISNELMDLLTELKFDKLPLNYYLFGKLGKPSDITFGRTWYSDLYFKIKVTLSLDKNYTMYGWKHTRVISLIGAGFKDEDIMKLTGHTDYQSFLAYKRDLVVDNSVMSGKTVGWIK